MRISGKKRLFLRIIIGIFSVIFCIIIILYSTLWIYVNSNRDEDAIKNYKQKINVTLTDEQAKIIWFSYTNNKKYKFTWYPLLFEIFLKDRKDNIDIIAAEIITGDHREYLTMKLHFVTYAMKRYVNRKINWKECIDILASNSYFGNKYHGIKNASEGYYNKPIEELTEKELIGLTVMSKRPNSIEFNSNRFFDEINKIYDGYNND